MVPKFYVEVRNKGNVGSNFKVIVRDNFGASNYETIYIPPEDTGIASIYIVPASGPYKYEYFDVIVSNGRTYDSKRLYTPKISYASASKVYYGKTGFEIKFDIYETNYLELPRTVFYLGVTFARNSNFYDVPPIRIEHTGYGYKFRMEGSGYTSGWMDTNRFKLSFTSDTTIYNRDTGSGYKLSNLSSEDIIDSLGSEPNKVIIALWYGYTGRMVGLFDKKEIRI